MAASQYNSRAESLQQRLSGLQTLKYLLSSPLQEKFAKTALEGTTTIPILHMRKLPV